MRSGDRLLSSFIVQFSVSRMYILKVQECVNWYLWTIFLWHGDQKTYSYSLNSTDDKTWFTGFTTNDSAYSNSPFSIEWSAGWPLPQCWHHVMVVIMIQSYWWNWSTGTVLTVTNSHSITDFVRQHSFNHSIVCCSFSHRSFSHSFSRSVTKAGCYWSQKWVWPRILLDQKHWGQLIRFLFFSVSASPKVTFWLHLCLISSKVVPGILKSTKTLESESCCSCRQLH